MAADKSNKDAIVAIDNLIISNKIATKRQIDAFEEKFDQFFQWCAQQYEKQINDSTE